MMPRLLAPAVAPHPSPPLFRTPSTPPAAAGPRRHTLEKRLTPSSKVKKLVCTPRDTWRKAPSAARGKQGAALEAQARGCSCCCALRLVPALPTRGC